MKGSLKPDRLAGALLLVMLVAGCAAESVDLMFVRPGQFDYLSCTEIAGATRSAMEREQELQALTERAEKESFGALVAAAAYRSDTLQAQGQLRLLAEAARNKKCPPEMAPPRGAPQRR
jgi:hypothetical protein